MRILILFALFAYKQAHAISLSSPGDLPWTTTAVLSNEKVAPGHADADACAGLVIVNPLEDPAIEATWPSIPELDSIGQANCATISADCTGNVCDPVFVK